MDGRGPDVTALASQLEAEFFAQAEEVPAPEGRVYLSAVSLEAFVEDRLGPDALEQFETIDQFLEEVTGEEPETLVEYAGNGEEPAGEYWYLGAFRLADRGYIYLWMEEWEGPFQPVLGCWEPYNSQPAFEACFLAVYWRHFDAILFGTQYATGLGVSRDLLARALWDGLERAEEHPRWKILARYGGGNLPLETPEQRRVALRSYLDHAERDEV